MTGIILALMLPTTSAHADWCSGVVVSNGVCSEFTVPPAIVRCDYPDGSNSDPRCVGIRERRPAFDPPLPKSRAPR